MNMQRAQFEQWAQRNGYLIEKLQDNHATYEFSSTLNAYHGWQAATEQSQKEIADLQGDINSYVEIANKNANTIVELQAREKVLVEALDSIAKVNHSSAKCGAIAHQALANVNNEKKG